MEFGSYIWLGQWNLVPAYGWINGIWILHMVGSMEFDSNMWLGQWNLIPAYGRTEWNLLV